MILRKLRDSFFSSNKLNDDYLPLESKTSTGAILDHVFEILALEDLCTAQNKCLIIDLAQHAKNIGLVIKEVQHARFTREFTLPCVNKLSQDDFISIINHVDDLPLLIQALKQLNKNRKDAEWPYFYLAQPDTLMAILTAIDNLKGNPEMEANIKNIVSIFVKLHDESIYQSMLCKDYWKPIIAYPELSGEILQRMQNWKPYLCIKYSYFQTGILPKRLYEENQLHEKHVNDFDNSIREICGPHIKNSIKESLSATAQILTANETIEMSKLGIFDKFNKDALCKVIPDIIDSYLLEPKTKVKM